MRRITVMLSIVLVLAIAVSASAKDKKSGSNDYMKHPGYIDFDPTEIFGDREPTVEVNLKQPMLELVSKFAEDEEPEAMNLLKKLMLVRVNVYEAEEGLIDKFRVESAKVVKQLDGKGWERIVRVNDDDERVVVYLKPSADYEFIQGIFVIAVEDDEAVFVNIVGDIHPEDIDELGEYLGIDELEGIGRGDKD
jgi:hypothetical protein